METKYTTIDSALAAIDETPGNLEYVSGSLQIAEPKILYRVIEKNPFCIRLMHYHVPEKRPTLYRDVLARALMQAMIIGGSDSLHLIHHKNLILRNLDDSFSRYIQLKAWKLYLNLTTLSSEKEETNAAKMLYQILISEDRQSENNGNSFQMLYRFLFCCRRISNTQPLKTTKVPVPPKKSDAEVEDGHQAEKAPDFNKHIVSYLSMFDFYSMSYVSNKKDFKKSRKLLPEAFLRDKKDFKNPSKLLPAALATL